MTEESPSPLDRFIDQFLADQEAGEERPLGKYLEAFPGADSEIAREFLSLTDAGETPKSPDQIGHYHLIRELGRGGQAVVYLAEDMRIRVGRWR